MRKIFLILVFIPLFVSAQSDIKHLSFMGIPLTGSLDVFAEKLMTKNPSWKRVEFIADSICRFKGDFFDIENCTITIWTYKQFNNQVTKASVLVTSNLEELAEGMINKYGPGSTHNTNSGVESIWILDEGKVHMELFSIPGSSFITIDYTDFVEAADELKKSIRKYDDL
jgi:hypothetical protein